MAEPADRDYELARLIRDFLRRDGFPLLNERQVNDLACTLSQRHHEGRIDARQEMASEIRPILERRR
jgi:hypothetical protein